MTHVPHTNPDSQKIQRVLRPDEPTPAPTGAGHTSPTLQGNSQVTLQLAMMIDQINGLSSFLGRVTERVEA